MIITYCSCGAVLDEQEIDRALEHLHAGHILTPKEGKL